MKSTIYVSRPLLNASKLAAYAQAVGLKNVLMPVEMHVTLAYSSDKVDWLNPVFIPDRTTILVEGGPRNIRRFDGGAVVMTFESSLLSRRWAAFIMAGASWDYADYIPHVTLAYDEDTRIDGLTPSSLVMRFGPEVRKPLDPDWSAKVLEEA
jgi:uncharacterized protein